jgi:YggT family protein
MELICLAIGLYMVILFVRVILSWVQAFGGRIPMGLDPAVEVIYRITEPLLQYFRRFIPPVGGLDLSVLVIFLGLSFVRQALC